MLGGGWGGGVYTTVLSFTFWVGFEVRACMRRRDVQTAVHY